jgi:hypothetical protein
MKFNKNKTTIVKELDHFFQILDKLLPYYSELSCKIQPSQEELKELGEIEYTLIEVNARISELKEKLDFLLFNLNATQVVEQTTLPEQVVRYIPGKYSKIIEKENKTTNWN